MRDCYCEYVDIGVGSMRVTNEPGCPVHDPYWDSTGPLTPEEEEEIGYG